MGFFFSSSSSKKDKPKPKNTKIQSPAYLNPPNVYVTPAIPPRPATAGPTSHDKSKTKTKTKTKDKTKDKDKDRKREKDRENRRARRTHHQNASTPQLQIAAAPHESSPSQHHHQQQQIQHHSCGPVIVNQHYYLGAPPHHHALPNPPYGGGRSPYSGLGADAGNVTGSFVNLAKDMSRVPSRGDGLCAWYGYGTQVVGSTINTFDDIAYQLNNVLTLIDNEGLKGHEMDLFHCRQPMSAEQHEPEPESNAASKSSKKSSSKDRARDKDKQHKVQPTAEVAAAVVRGNYFSKVELYANSKLPKNLDPFAVYFPTWPLLTLAAQYSQAVYAKPSSAEREAHISSDWLSSTKAMTIKSLPMDHMHTIVFAIRGTASFMDWAVNLNAEPASPTGLLDDPGNLCHSGFLSVARRTLKPVASRLKELLREDPNRARYSLLITGHSAGGAVASLLYAHMLSRSESTRSELNTLTARFRKVHCINFGTPPISLLPILKPNRPELKNSVFLSFVNEGDPVVRADKAYVKSLLELLASPAPSVLSSSSPRPQKSKSLFDLKSSSRHQHSPLPSSSDSPATEPNKPVWPVPPCSLSNAGRIVILRSAGRRANDINNSSKSSSTKRQDRDRMTVEERLAEGVVAGVCDEDELRHVIWGDPAAHMMNLYAGRIDLLAVNAVKPPRQ